MSIKCPSPSLLVDFSVKSVLLDIRMATPACFLGSFVWKTFSQPFTLSRCLSLWLRCVFCKQQNVGSCFPVQSRSLCLFIGELSPLILSDINDQWLLTPVFFWGGCGSGVYVFPFFEFCLWRVARCLSYCRWCWECWIPWVVICLLILSVRLDL